MEDDGIVVVFLPSGLCIYKPLFYVLFHCVVLHII